MSGAAGQALNRAQEKRRARLKAIAALAGIVVIDSVDERGQPELIASRWALTKAFSSLDDLEAWLNTVTGRAA